ncbi:MAG: LysR family transcriptional regulator [Gemmatimonadaceae bacterium]
MPTPDLGLLVPLNVLLTEGSVARAAERLRLSPSAMSRTLARLRKTTGDPLLVRAGRGLVPTPRALALRAQVRQLVEDGAAALRPGEKIDLKQLERSFTLRSRDGFVENFGPDLIVRVGREAPRVRLRFQLKTNKDSTALREGAVDLETAVVGKTTSPELRAQALFRDRYVGVVRKGHPLCKGRVTAQRFAAGRHVVISRRGLEKGAIDEAMQASGIHVSVVATVGGYAAALAIVRASDLIVCVPAAHTGTLRDGMHSFTLPFATPEITISLLWHPRLDADPAQRWFRECVRSVCGKVRT